MYICMGHFLETRVKIFKNGALCGKILSVDTDLMIAVQICGYNPTTGQPLTELIVIDQIDFDKNGLDPDVAEQIPDFIIREKNTKEFEEE